MQHPMFSSYFKILLDENFMNQSYFYRRQLLRHPVRVNEDLPLSAVMSNYDENICCQYWYVTIIINPVADPLHPAGTSNDSD